MLYRGLGEIQESTPSVHTTWIIEVAPVVILLHWFESN